MSQLSDYQLKADLYQLNQKNHRLDAELLLYLGELDQRRLYREEACSSAFGFCVTRMGYSEDVAYKRVGAARLLRQFPRIYDLLAEGRIHLTALMLLKPHLTVENHEECLLAACHKSKREVEMLVATRWPAPDAAATVRKLPSVKPAPAPTFTPQPTRLSAPAEEAASTTRSATDTTPLLAVSDAAAVTDAVASAAVEPYKAFELTATPNAAASRTGLVAQVAQVAQVAPLSSSTYRVTFTASEQLKQKLDRARELLSHCIPPSDLPALLERSLDQLLEREQTRRYGASPKCRPAASPPNDCLAKPQRPTAGPSSNSAGASAKSEEQRPNSQDPDLARPVNNASIGRCVAITDAVTTGESVAITNAVTTGESVAITDAGTTGESVAITDAGTTGESVAITDAGTTGKNVAMVGAAADSTERTTSQSGHRRQVKAAVRRAVFDRDAGQCTFVDRQGRRCDQRHFLEFDHVEAYAIGGTATVCNLRLRCQSHNLFEAERLFGQQRVKAAIAHKRQHSGHGS